MTRLTINEPEPRLEPPEEEMVGSCWRCGMDFARWSRFFWDDGRMICGECIKEIATQELTVSELAAALGYVEGRL